MVTNKDVLETRGTEKKKLYAFVHNLRETLTMIPADNVGMATVASVF